MQLEMTPPLEDCGLFSRNHGDPYSEEAIPITIPIVEPMTPESLPVSSPGRKRSVTTTTTNSSSVDTMDSSRIDATAQQHHRPPFHCRKSQSTSDIILSPQMVEDLHREHAYLSMDLGKQSNRAANLIRRYASIESQLDACNDVSSAGGSNPATKVRRYLRKQLSMLRVEIRKVGQQEVALASRLGEVGIKLQNYEIWRREREGPYPLWLNTRVGYDGGTSIFSLPSSSHVMSPETPLNALSPIFVPGVLSLDAALEADTTGLSTVIEAREDFACNHGLEFEYCCEPDDDMIGVVRRRRSSIDGSEASASRQRRLSLPNMSTLWPVGGEYEMEI